MPKGVYERSESHKEHSRTINIGRKPWNKGLKEKQVAWNKGIEYAAIKGEKNPRWSGGLTKLEKQELEAGRKKPKRCEICYEHSIINFDHCHNKGFFRGWICRRCNLVLGFVKDDQVLLRNLAQYLDNSYDETRPERLMDALLTHHGDVQDIEA